MQHDAPSGRGEARQGASAAYCVPARNPFNADKPTLLVVIVDNEARHSDADNAITDGNAFDFAELHYKLTDNELLQTLNTSNILQTQITNTSNLIFKDAHSNTIVRISATNENGGIFGSPVEMLFHTVDGDCNTKINEDGELMVYHPIAPLPAGFSPGWWGVENRIANVITDTQGLRL